MKVLRHYHGSTSEQFPYFGGWERRSKPLRRALSFQNIAVAVKVRDTEGVKMARRSTPSTAETLRLMRHLADVAAMKHDPPAQRQLLIDGFNRLFNTTFGWFAAVDDYRFNKTPKPAVGVLTSDCDLAYQRYIADWGVYIAPANDPYGYPSLRSNDSEQLWTRQAVLHDTPAERRRYSAALSVIEGSKIGDGTVGMFRTGPRGDRVVAFSLHRAKAEPWMTPRDFALHRLAVRELRLLHERGHLPLAQPPSQLPPRLRQLLDQLLAGNAPKAIARNLGLSLWTVRDHIKRLYKHFGVHGREELMAKYVGRFEVRPARRID